MCLSQANGQFPGEVRPLIRQCEQLGRAAQMTKPCVGVCPYCRRRGRIYSPSGGTSLHTVTNGGSSAGPRREGQCTPLQSTPAASGPRSSMAHRPPTPPTRRRRQRAHGANSHAPWLQPPSSTPLRSGGLPLWATAPSPEPGPWGRTKPRPATPAPKPRPTSPSAFQQHTGTRK